MGAAAPVGGQQGQLIPVAPGGAPMGQQGQQVLGGMGGQAPVLNTLAAPLQAAGNNTVSHTSSELAPVGVVEGGKAAGKRKMGDGLASSSTG